MNTLLTLNTKTTLLAPVFSLQDLVTMMLSTESSRPTLCGMEHGESSSSESDCSKESKDSLSRAASVRSNSIRIETSSSASAALKEEVAEPACICTGEMYERATWRMFNRITSHRQRFPVKPPTSTMIPMAASCRFQPLRPVLDTSLSPESQLGVPYIAGFQQEEGTPDQYMDGEVFELDM